MEENQTYENNNKNKKLGPMGPHEPQCLILLVVLFLLQGGGEVREEVGEFAESNVEYEIAVLDDLFYVTPFVAIRELLHAHCLFFKFT